MKEQFLYGLLINPEFLDPAGLFFGGVVGASKNGDGRWDGRDFP